MSQIFHPSINLIAKVLVLVTVLGLILAGAVLYLFVRSPYMRVDNVARAQPVAFSHDHHVGDLGLDCRYCHVNVERSGFAGVPSTDICMGCHSQVWADSAAIAPIKESEETQQAIAWNRLNSLPDYVYFDHSIHVNKGVGCEECHGRIDTMGLTRREENLSMEWCLNCHRNRDEVLRPKDQIFAMGYEPPADKAAHQALQSELVQQYHINMDAEAFNLDDCSICHR